MIAAPFEKTYLSRAQSRIWSMDNPVGDPFGGPAYGEKREPVSMIAAVVAIGVGATEIAAASTVLGMVMSGMMIAGGAASLIGTVSGNKQLAMIGGAVAGLGGLGLAGSNFLAQSASTTVVAEGSSEAASSGLIDAIPDPQFGTEVTANVAAPTAGLQDAIPDPQLAVTGEFNQPVTGDLATQNLVANNANSPVTNSLNVLDTNDAGQVAMNNNLIDGSTPDSVFQNINDTAAADVQKLWADNPNMQQYASNQTGVTDVPVGNAQAPQNLNPFDKYSVENNPNVFDAGYTSAEQTGPQGVIKPTAEEVAAAQKAGDPNYTPQNGSWLDKIEGIAKGIEKYKTTVNLGGNLISGAMKYAVPSQLDQATIDAYNAKANLANAEAGAIAAAEERRRRQNEAVKNLKPIQLNNPMNPIFGNALNGAGIINSARA